MSLTLAFSESRKAGAIVTLQERRWKQLAGRSLRRPGRLRGGGNTSPGFPSSSLGQAPSSECPHLHTIGRALGWGSIPDPSILPIFDLLGSLEKERE